MPPLYQQQPKEVTISWQFWNITTTTTNTMLLLIIIIIMSKIQFLLQMHKKDLFLLPTSTEMIFNTTNSPWFYSSAIHLSLIILRTTRCDILLNTEQLPSNKIWPSVSPDLILQKVHDFRRTDGIALCTPERWTGTSAVRSCHANL